MAGIVVIPNGVCFEIPRPASEWADTTTPEGNRADTQCLEQTSSMHASGTLAVKQNSTYLYRVRLSSAGRNRSTTSGSLEPKKKGVRQPLPNIWRI